MNSATENSRLALLLSYNRMLLNYHWYKRYGMEFMPIIDEVDETFVEDADNNLDEQATVFSENPEIEEDSDNSTEPDEVESSVDQAEPAVEDNVADDTQTDEATDQVEENLKPEDLED